MFSTLYEVGQSSFCSKNFTLLCSFLWCFALLFQLSKEFQTKNHFHPTAGTGNPIWQSSVGDRKLTSLESFLWSFKYKNYVPKKTLRHVWEQGQIILSEKNYSMVSGILTFLGSFLNTSKKFGVSLSNVTWAFCQDQI